MPNVLRISESAMQHMVRACRVRMPDEACGFIVADRERPDFGVRCVVMKNVHPNPHNHYRMDDQSVRLAYGDFDRNEEEVVAVFHSHPTGGPFMSDADLEAAADESLAYVIVSFDHPVRKVRAYTVKRFIGNTVASGVQIQVIEEHPEPKDTLPVGPWALQSGNRVRIGYQRVGKATLATVVATVIACDRREVTLDPDNKTGPRTLQFERIRSVHVLREGAVSAAMRTQLRAYASEARALLAGHDTMALPSLLEAMFHAYPPGVAITMDET